MFILLAAALPVSAVYFPPSDAEGGWRCATNGQSMIRRRAGLDARRLDQAGEYNQRCSQNAGLLVVRHGWLALERYVGRANREARPDMASTGKAYTSIACGILLQEFAGRFPAGLDITLGHLLCMSGGYTGEGGAPTAVVMGRSFPLKPVPGQDLRDLDGSSLRCAMWTNAGGGYSYSSPEPHIASMVLRRVSGMDLREYIDARLAKPMGWGAWNYCLHRGNITLPHANGAGSIAVAATDALRFGYCLLQDGRWGNRQLVPSNYIAQCRQMSRFNPHSPYSLMFEHNADGHVAGAPRDAFWKSGAGGFALIVVPSLDLVIYKMGGNHGQYDPALTRVPQPPGGKDRDDWKPLQGTPFQEPSNGGDGGIRRVLEMVCAATVD